MGGLLLRAGCLHAGSKSRACAGRETDKHRISRGRDKASCRRLMAWRATAHFKRVQGSTSAPGPSAVFRLEHELLGCTTSSLPTQNGAVDDDTCGRRGTQPRRINSQQHMRNKNKCLMSRVVPQTRCRHFGEWGATAHVNTVPLDKKPLEFPSNPSGAGIALRP
jgi:hypothetical protein